MPPTSASFAGIAASVPPDPLTYHQAVTSPEAAHWHTAMQAEMDSLARNHTWSLLPLPVHRQAIACKWVYHIKTTAKGDISKYKARLVAKGFSQQYGIDYQETFSPVVKFDSIRTVLSLAASQDMHIAQFDVKSAFLYGELSEELYMEQAPGFVVNKQAHLVYKLHKSIYGLKQASRVWNHKFTRFLETFHLQPTTADPCVFTSKTQPQLFLILFVDDGLICCPDASRVHSLVAYLKSEFDVTEGTGDLYVGLHIVRDRAQRRLWIH